MSTLHSENLRHLILIDMPSIDICPVLSKLPDLKTLHLKNVEEINEDTFMHIYNKLISYQGLEVLILELVSFDLENNKEKLLDILVKHSQTLRIISLSRNKVTSKLIEYLCEGIKESNNI